MLKENLYPTSPDVLVMAQFDAGIPMFNICSRDLGEHIQYMTVSQDLLCTGDGGAYVPKGDAGLWYFCTLKALILRILRIALCIYDAGLFVFVPSIRGSILARNLSAARQNIQGCTHQFTEA